MLELNDVQGHAAGRPPGLTDDDLAGLAELPLFAGLDQAEIVHLLANARVESRPAGAMLFLQGDPAAAFFAVLAGWVKLYRSTEEGHESVIAMLPEGESFAEAAAFEDATYPVSAAVIEDARLLIIPAQPFLAKVINDGRLVVKMMASMSRRLRQLVNQVQDLNLKSSVQRVASYLHSLCRVEAGATTVDLPLDKALIARHLGMQPETLSRSLARLRTEGVVSDGGRVSIADVAALRRLCGDDSHATPSTGGAGDWTAGAGSAGRTIAADA